MVEPFASGLPWLDVTAVKEDLVSLDAGEGVGDVDFPHPDRFDLGAFEFKAGFVFVEDVEIPAGLPVGGDFGAHRRVWAWRPGFTGEALFR